MPRIAIIGGGIIGLATAYYLRKHNQEVIVVDKGIPGEACSAGNMGWICPTLSEPVPAPGLVGKSLKWMMKSDSPLYIKPSAIPSLSSWLFQFWKNCNEETFHRGFDAALEISKNTLKLFDELEAEGLVEFEIHRKGLLFAFLQQKGLDERFHELSVVEKIGLPKPVLKSKREVLELEPALSEDVIGGLLLPSERHVRPESLSRGFCKWLEENGVDVRVNTEVTDFVQKNGRIVEIRSGTKRIEADQYLLTSGVWSGELVKQLGFSLPMTAGKGYSITISSPAVQIRQPLYLGDTKTGISPYNNAVRIAGTMELSGVNTNIDQRRVQGLRNSASKYLKIPVIGERERVWTGMRPMTPDGLPVLGRIPGISNLYVATGHAMSGVSMSLSTGYIMSDFIRNGKTEIDLTPFSPERFAGWVNMTSAIRQ